MRYLSPLFLLAAALGHAYLQDDPPILIRLPVAAFGSVRTGVLELRPSDRVHVKPVDGSSGTPSVDTYISREDHQLAGKDDDEAVATEFSWSPPEPGRYYILVRNASAVDGIVEVRIDRTRSDVPAPFPSHVVQRVFFATNRVHQPSSLPAQRFGAERASDGALTYGMCYVSIPRNHQMGELEGPSIFRLEFRPDTEKHVVLVGVNSVGREEFLRRVSDRVQSSQGREALVFVHGFNVTFEDAARRAAQITYDLAFAGAPILFSWPSRGKMSLVDYNADSRNSDLSVNSLEQFLRELAVEAGVSTLHIVAHSMGNRVLTGALKNLAAAPRGASVKVNQVALMAPDMDADLFRTISGAVASAAERVTLYVSSADDALAVSRRLAGGYRRAGEAGPGIVVTRGIDTVDVTSVGADILGHSYFANNTSVLADLYNVFRKALPRERFGLRARPHPNGVFWEYRPAVR